MINKNYFFAVIILLILHFKIFTDSNGLHSYRVKNVFSMAAQIYGSGSGGPLTIPVPVYQGGTGLTALTDNAILIGDNTTQAATTNAATVGTVLIGNTGAIPTFSATPSVTKITIVDSPTIGIDGTNKAYVDLYASGLIVQAACVCATTTILSNTPVYDNGASGVGATLTATVNGALTIDGISVATSNRVLIKDQAASSQNGIYTVTDPGSGGSVYVLTRATDFDTTADIKPGALVPVQLGATYADTIWIETATVTTIGTDPILFSEFLKQGIVTLTGDTGSATGISVNVIGGNNITTSASGSMMTISLTGTTNHAVQVGNTSGSLTSLAVASVNGQVLLGATGANPSFVTPTAGSGLTLTSNATTLQYALTIPISAGNGGTGSTSLTQYAVLVGNGTSAIATVSPSATSGIPIVSQGSSANPQFTTAQVAGGGTGVTSFANVYGVIIAGTTSTNPLQVTATPPAATPTLQGLVSAGASAVPTWQNVLPGYIVAANNFAYAGSTSTPVNSPARTILISPTSSAGLLSTATDNTAVGFETLNALTSGTGNVMIGSSSGRLITTATNSVGIGYRNLYNNVSGTGNTGLGYTALQNGNTSFNTCAGFGSLIALNTGANNTAFGFQALGNCTNGSNNTAVGGQAAKVVTTASGVTTVGVGTLSSLLVGSNNTIIGSNTGTSITGTDNTMLGYSAGLAATSGSNNILIGYIAQLPAITDSNTIIIGNSTTTTATIKGIFGTTTGGAAIPVLIDSNGQLGTVISSSRFKKNIIPVDNQTAEKISMLDIVTFSYIDDATNKIHYGALAEDVEKIFPELVIYDENGDLLTIQYDQFIPLLIKYIQEKEKTLQQASQKITTMKATVATLSQAIHG